MLDGRNSTHGFMTRTWSKFQPSLSNGCLIVRIRKRQTKNERSYMNEIRYGILWATSRSRVPVDGAAIASDVRESSCREQSQITRGRLNLASRWERDTKRLRNGRDWILKCWRLCERYFEAAGRFHKITSSMDSFDAF
ncbi:hypothetical protein AVEN_272386-1 [Araneus ventricosus]|uniref:Uncharacterized protein n=1 Tax=Araneus ventricosus TaxID=182803 RepID=A0A4Y2I0F5_ARAVE|nr:hypothetical protein AVEN_272386-1 [Araneus ventricosus]